MFPLSVYIYVYKLLGPKQSKTNRPPCISPGCCFTNCLLTPCHLLLPPKPLHNATYKTQKQTCTNTYTNKLPLSPDCPKLPSVHLREDTQCDPSPPKCLIKLRCTTTFQTTCSYPLSLWLNHGEKKGSTHTMVSSD